MEQEELSEMESEDDEEMSVISQHSLLSKTSCISLLDHDTILENLKVNKKYTL